MSPRPMVPLVQPYSFSSQAGHGRVRRLRRRDSGTRDFFPEEMRVRNWLFAAFRETARKVAPLLRLSFVIAAIVV